MFYRGGLLHGGSYMPVTARLSRKFYDQFGDEIANELVEWFNKVDETYRTGLRELNDLNYARFDARLEQRLAEFSASLRTEMAGMAASIRGEMAGMEASLRTDMAEMGASIRQEIAVTQTATIRWMVGLWAAQVTIFVGVIFTVLQAR
jgi:hypothetical protein